MAGENSGPRVVTQYRMQQVCAAVDPGERVTIGMLIDRTDIARSQLQAALRWLQNEGEMELVDGGRVRTWKRVGAIEPEVTA